MILLFCSASAASETLETRIINKAVGAGLDPALVLAIVRIESAFNPKARGRRDEIGLFQLRKKFHGEGLELVEKNIEVGIKYLQEVKDLCEADYQDAWFICFNHGPNFRVKYPKKFKYYKKVMNIYEKYKAKISD